MKNIFNEAVIVEKNNKKYALLPLCLFSDIPVETRHSAISNQFGLKDIYETKNIYEITDEKKFMMLKIKYDV